MPLASTAYVALAPVPTWTRPMVPWVSSTPVASGLMPPVPAKAGPRPMKIRRPWPAKTLAVVWPDVPGSVTVVKVKLPSTVTKSPISSVIEETETAKARVVGGEGDGDGAPADLDLLVDRAAGGVDADEAGGAGLDPAVVDLEGAGEVARDARWRCRG